MHPTVRASDGAGAGRRACRAASIERRWGRTGCWGAGQGWRWGGGGAAHLLHARALRHGVAEEDALGLLGVLVRLVLALLQLGLDARLGLGLGLGLLGLGLGLGLG